MNAPFPRADALTGRTCYKSSGAINFGSFLLWSVLASAVAILLAALMFWLYHVGHYYVIIVPFICAVAVAGMARLAIAKGHCRNWLVGSLTGLALGVILYFGSYYIGMLYHLGPEAAGQPQVFIEYIRLRLATDVVRDAYKSNRDENRRNRSSGSQGLNWVRFGIESIGVIGIIMAGSYRRSRKTYCERCNRWLEREMTLFEPDKASGIIESLKTGSARELAVLCATPPYVTVPNTTMAVEYCPSLKAGSSRDCHVYVSLKNVTTNPKGATLDGFEQSKGKVLARCVQLTPDELPALAPRFAMFEAYAGRAAVASLLPAQDSEDAHADERGSSEMAEIISLGSDHKGKVLTRKRMWKGVALGLGGLGGFLGGMGMLALGASILEHVESSATKNGFGITLCIVGGILVLVALAGILFDSTFGGNRLLRKAFNAELARRTGKWVEPNEAGSVFVEIVPKLNWGKLMLDNASDIGWLLVDKSKREIRFEGDHERWRIPAASITSSEVEQYVHGEGAAKTRIYYVVLRATRRNGFWEAPVRERRGTGALSSKRKKLARQLAATIEEIRGTAPIGHRGF